MLWVAGLCLVLSIALFLLFSRMNVIIHYTYNQDEENDLIHVTVRLYRIQLYQKDINPFQLSKHSSGWNDWTNKTFMERIQFMTKGVKTSFTRLFENYKVTSPLMQKIRIKSFSWYTECGTGSALTAGTVCGAIWAAKGVFVRLLQDKAEAVQDVHLNVKPRFQKEVLSTELYCIVSMTIGKAILAILNVRKHKNIGAKERKDTGG